MYLHYKNGNLESCAKTSRKRRAVDKQSKRLVHIIASDFLFEVGCLANTLKKSTGANIGIE